MSAGWALGERAMPWRVDVHHLLHCSPAIAVVSPVTATTDLSCSLLCLLLLFSNEQENMSCWCSSRSASRKTASSLSYRTSLCVMLRRSMLIMVLGASVRPFVCGRCRFVCPTELLAFNDRLREFEELDTEVLAMSVDSAHTLLAWCVGEGHQGAGRWVGGTGDVQG